MGVEPGAELFDFNEPSPTGKAGFGTWKNPKSPYDRFMEDQGISIHRDIGVHKVQDLPFKPWKRLGGRGIGHGGGTLGWIGPGRCCGPGTAESTERGGHSSRQATPPVHPAGASRTLSLAWPNFTRLPPGS